ncbi:hypothetical protein BXZ70DRAFT_948386 [Cristinia sonorae]|uniref:Uncharacterized protein n=1 Tax=Cristinia sonorae TaxID=1940300 RepID=A0A8K0XML0_9AGAR|nr:hypothetical protein BXZ70DRAFT_948386 [Cristinia sonorae]
MLARQSKATNGLSMSHIRDTGRPIGNITASRSILFHLGRVTSPTVKSSTLPNGSSSTDSQSSVTTMMVGRENVQSHSVSPSTEEDDMPSALSQRSSPVDVLHVPRTPSRSPAKSDLSLGPIPTVIIHSPTKEEVNGTSELDSKEMGVVIDTTLLHVPVPVRKSVRARRKSARSLGKCFVEIPVLTKHKRKHLQDNTTRERSELQDEDSTLHAETHDNTDSPVADVLARDDIPAVEDAPVPEAPTVNKPDIHDTDVTPSTSSSDQLLPVYNPPTETVPEITRTQEALLFPPSDLTDTTALLAASDTQVRKSRSGRVLKRKRRYSDEPPAVSKDKPAKVKKVRLILKGPHRVNSDDATGGAKDFQKTTPMSSFDESDPFAQAYMSLLNVPITRSLSSEAVFPAVTFDPGPMHSGTATHTTPAPLTSPGFHDTAQASGTQGHNNAFVRAQSRTFTFVPEFHQGSSKDVVDSSSEIFPTSHITPSQHYPSEYNHDNFSVITGPGIHSYGPFTSEPPYSFPFAAPYRPYDQASSGSANNPIPGTMEFLLSSFPADSPSVSTAPVAPSNLNVMVGTTTNVDYLIPSPPLESMFNVFSTGIHQTPAQTPEVLAPRATVQSRYIAEPYEVPVVKPPLKAVQWSGETPVFTTDEHTSSSSSSLAGALQPVPLYRSARSQR